MLNKDRFSQQRSLQSLRGCARLRQPWVLQFLTRYKSLMALSLLLGLLVAIFSLGLMATSGYLISASATAPGTILLLQFALIFIRVFGVGRPPLRHIERYISHDWVLRLTTDLRMRFWVALEQRSVRLTSQEQLGKILGILNSDIAHMQQLYLRSVFPLIVSVALVGIVLAIVAKTSMSFFLSILIPLVLIVLVLPLMSVLLDGARKLRLQELKKDLYLSLSDTIFGIGDWQSSGNLDRMLAQTQEIRAQIHKLKRSSARFSRYRDVLSNIFFALSFAIVIYYVAQLYGHEHAAILLELEPEARVHIAANWIAAWVLAAFALADNLAQVSPALEEGFKQLAAIESIGSYELASQKEYKDLLEEDVQRDKISLANKTISGDLALNTKGIGAEDKPFILCLEDLHFQYKGQTRPLLKDINLEMKLGESLMILGKSGCGKSSLAALIRGDEIPTSGKISLGKKMAYEVGGELVSYVEQNSHLFATTILENLRLAKPDLCEQEAWEVLELVDLKERIALLSDGVHSYVDEGAWRFSGGERQRLALARAFLQNRPIVILDEPSTGLDPQTEAQVLSAAFKLFKDRILIIVTHHLAQADKADRIVFLSQGNFVLEGSYDSLYQNSPRFKALVDTDF